jgi:hypothetical protein
MHRTSNEHSAEMTLNLNLRRREVCLVTLFLT